VVRDRLHATALLLGLGLVLQACSAAPPPEAGWGFDGPDDVLNADTVEDAVFVVHAEEDPLDELDDLRVLLDGEDVTDEAELDGDRLVFPARNLDDGQWLVAISLPGADEEAEPHVLHEWRVTVDTVPPEIDITSPDGAVAQGEALTVAGTTEAGATVELSGVSVTADDDGAFELEFDEIPDETTLVATDAAGNVSEHELTLLTVPSRVEVDEFRSVHVSFCAWATPSLRDPVLELIDEGLINAVQLDLKDETGKVGFDLEHEMAARVGADQPDCRIDLDAAVEQLHELGVPVIGRVVAFADPVLAQLGLEQRRARLGDPDRRRARSSSASTPGFGNFAHPDVIDYNLSVAEEAAAAGVDHILWDYIRKPDGPFEQFRFVGLETSAEESIVEFTRLADERLAPYGVLHGASLYGVSADRPPRSARTSRPWPTTSTTWHP
jgi:hypothetical protein